MGLDMYLEKRHYVKNWDHMPPERLHQIAITRGGQPTNIAAERISYVVEEVAYWRKANAIHRWFVDNVQDGNDDCGHYSLSADTLRKLVAECDRVLAAPDVAADVLPTREGFFFGGTDYDEYYFAELKMTKSMLEAVLAEPGADEAEYSYHSSW